MIYLFVGLLFLSFETIDSRSGQIDYEVWDLVEIRNVNGRKEYMADNKISLLLFNNGIFIRYFTRDYCSIGHFDYGVEFGNLSMLTYLRKEPFEHCLAIAKQGAKLSNSKEVLDRSSYQVEYSSDKSEMILIGELDKKYKYVKGVMPVE